MAVLNRAPSGAPRLAFLDPLSGAGSAQRTYGTDEIPLDRVTTDLASNGVIASGIVERQSNVNMRDVAIRLDGTGAPTGELWRSQDLHTRPATAADGAVAYGNQAAGVPDGQIVLRLPDGTVRTLLAGIIPRSVAFADDGDVVAVLVGVGLVAPAEWQGFWLSRFGRDGSVRWRRAIGATATDAPQLAVGSDGTIVFTLRAATAAGAVSATWGQNVSGALVVLAATSSGEPLWARGLGDASAAYSAAVDPARGIALVKVGPAGSCPSLSAELLRFDASRAWTRDFPCGSGTIAGASPVVGTDAPIHVAGVLRGAFDFGAGTLTSQPDGSPFVVQLVP